MTTSFKHCELDRLLEGERWIRRLAAGLTSDPDVADDLQQETRITLMREETFTAGSAGAWLKRVMTNLLRDRHRAEGRRRRREVAYAESASDPPTPADLHQRIELHRLLAELVSGLAEPYRQTVILRYYEECTAAEIARRTGVPAGTVRWRLKVGLDDLRERLDAHFEDDRRRWMVLVGGLGPRRGERTAGGAGGALSLAGRVGLVVALALVATGGAQRLAARRETPATAITGAGGDPRGRVARPRLPRLVAPPASAPAVALAKPPAWFGQRGLAARPLAGQVLSEGRPVVGARVRLDSAASAAVPGLADQTVTGADGRFAFAPQPAWLFLVSASVPGGATTVVTVDLREPGAAEVRLDLERCTRRVGGRIIDDVGNTLAGAEVRRLGDTPFALGARVDGEGRYELCAGDRPVRLHARAPGYGAIVRTLGPDSAGEDIVLAEEGRAAGRAVDAVSGQPVAGAQINVWPLDSAAAPGAALTDAEGRFEIGELAPGRYAAGVWSGTHAGLLDAQTLELQAGEVTPGTVLRLRPAATLAGVARAGGAPLPGARLRVIAGDGSESFSVVTQADGSFIAHGVPTGEVRLEVAGHRLLSPGPLALAPADHAGLAVEAVAEEPPACGVCPAAPPVARVCGAPRCPARLADTRSCR